MITPLRVAACVVLATVLGQTIVLWVMLAGAVVMLQDRQHRLESGRWMIYSTVLVLGVINSMKWPDSDLAEYFQYVDYATRSDFLPLLLDPDAFLSVRVTEPVFRVYVWLIGQFPWGARVLFSLASSVLTYGMMAALCIWLTQSVGGVRRGPSALNAGLAVTMALLLGVTFSLTGHIIRQYLAGGVFVLGLFGYSLQRRPGWLMLSLLSVCIHNSAVLLFIPLVLALVHRHRPRSAMAVLALIVLVSLSGAVPWIDDLAEVASFVKEDSQIGVALPVLDFLLIMGANRMIERSARINSQLRQAMTFVLPFVVAFAVLLFCIRDVPLLFFRSYFYLEFIRVPLLALLLCVGLERTGRWRWMLGFGGLIVAATLCWARVLGAEWSYQSAVRLLPDVVDMQSTYARWYAIGTTRL